MPVRTFDMTLVAELEDMKKRGQAYVGVFEEGTSEGKSKGGQQ